MAPSCLVKAELSIQLCANLQGLFDSSEVVKTGRSVAVRNRVELNQARQITLFREGLPQDCLRWRTAWRRGDCEVCIVSPVGCASQSRSSVCVRQRADSWMSPQCLRIILYYGIVETGVRSVRRGGGKGEREIKSNTHGRFAGEGARQVNEG